MIAPCAGALWIALTMAAASEPSPTPATVTAPSTGSIVAVRRPPPGDAVLAEAGSRIRSELAAMGLEGQFVDCPVNADNNPGACRNVEAAATISLAREDGVVELSVWTILSDGLELSRHIRVMAPDGGDDPAVLAVRAVELLRDLRLTGQRPPRPTGPARDDEDPKIPLPPPPPPVPPIWRLSTGVAMLASPASNEPGVGPALGLALSAGAVVGPRLLIFASFAGPFNTSISNPFVPGAPGKLVQALATLELRLKFRAGPLEPFVAVLTGVNYLKTTFPGAKTSDLPAIVSASVPLFGLGGGLSWSFWKRFYACVDAAVFGTQPDQLVEVYNPQAHIVARTGAPSVLISSAVGLSLP